MSLRNKLSPRIAVAVVAVLIAGVLLTWCTAAKADREMRVDLLQQTQLVNRAINVEYLQALSGTTADLGNPDYQRLEEQLAAVRSANPQCRFLYLMGRKVDGTVFFFLDSEPTYSKDYSPPGQVYTEVPASYRRVFDMTAEAVVGPETAIIRSREWS